MVYYSTRDKQRLNPFTLKDAAFAGLAPDGGLFIPESIPQVDMAKVEELAENDSVTDSENTPETTETNQ